MKKSIVFIIAILSLNSTDALAQNWKKVKGNGNVITQQRSVGSFDAVEAAGSFDIYLVKGNVGEMTILGDENLMEYSINSIFIYFLLEK